MICKQNITATARFSAKPGTPYDVRSLASPLWCAEQIDISLSRREGAGGLAGVFLEGLPFLLHRFVPNACSGEKSTIKHSTPTRPLLLVEEAAGRGAQAAAGFVLFVMFLGVVFGQGPGDGASNRTQKAVVDFVSAPGAGRATGHGTHQAPVAFLALCVAISGLAVVVLAVVGVLVLSTAGVVVALGLIGLGEALGWVGVVGGLVVVVIVAVAVTWVLLIVLAV